MVCGRQFQNRKGLGGHLATLKDPAHKAHRALQKPPAEPEAPSLPQEAAQGLTSQVMPMPPSTTGAPTVPPETPAWLEPALAGAGLAACALALFNLVQSRKGPQHGGSPRQPTPRQPPLPDPTEPSWMQAPGIGIRPTGGLRPVRREWWWL
jgi:hypothetical protein